MGTNESKIATESDEMKKLKEKIEKEGPAATSSYIEKNINRWKSEKVQFGVCGCVGTGKSSFINTVRGVRLGDVGYARVGFGDTTMTPKAYPHPDNPRIVYIDMPGVGTLMVKKENYINDMRICDCDFVFIFFDKVIIEDNLWLVGELDKLGKPYCFVRSKLDQDIKNEEQENMDKESVIYKIRKNITISMKENAKLENSKNVFLISSFDTSVGEMHELLSYVESNLDKFKCEAIMLSLTVLSEGVIDRKYKILQRKIKMVSLASALISANPMPVLDVVANIAILVSQLVHYIDSFGLSETRMQELTTFDRSVLKCNNILLPGANMAAFVVGKLGLFATIMVAENILDLFVPVCGSIISGATSAAITYKFLHDILKDIRHDAIMVYDHIKEQNSDIRL